MVNLLKIGDEFTSSTGDRWRVTDVGTRVIVAIELNKPTAEWYGGPPYAVVEHAWDEEDQLSIVEYHIK